MKTNYKGIILFLSTLVIPLSGFAQSDAAGAGFSHLTAQIIAYIDYVLVITSILSIKQFFWPGDNKTVFQLINMVCIILFYAMSLSFLIENKAFYEGYETLTPIGCIMKLFFSFDVYSILQLIIVAGFVINIIYVAKNRKGYYTNG